MPRPRKPEIMAPGGSWASLRAALQSGADAIYFGVRGFNMRENSCNFRTAELPRIAATCHDAGARAYLALNTIIYEEELPRVRRILTAAKAAGIDSVIAWDMAVIQTAADLALPVFLSTQMSVSNSAALEAFYRTYGIRRFVLARECTLAQIRTMRRRLRTRLGDAAGEIEIEVFAHGAMCVSVSGRCYMSEATTGKSANRGQCTQPCRRPYQITAADHEVSYRMGENYLLSPQDLCTLPFIEQLLQAGVHSLKLEGRGRPPEYVATVTAAYRRAVDFYFAQRRKPDFASRFQNLKDTLMRELDTVFHRGLSSGFFLGQPIDQWTGVPNNQSASRKARVGEVVKYYHKAAAIEIRVRETGFAPGDELLIQGPHTGMLRLRVDSIQIERQPVSEALRGQSVAVHSETPVRPGDQIYRLIPRNERRSG
ncbi:MAG: U32 family peptidase [Akkermansiaceae bacterium]|nr:U32 family peptidase [Akkermansiaceae bacterium]MCF7732955.1 U32 family peptidase [Akkermansiaceae bacterium]